MPGTPKTKYSSQRTAVALKGTVEKAYPDRPAGRSIYREGATTPRKIVAKDAVAEGRTAVLGKGSIDEKASAGGFIPIGKGFIGITPFDDQPVEYGKSVDIGQADDLQGIIQTVTRIPNISA